MSLALNVGNWWEYCGDESKAIKFVTQGDKCDLRRWQQNFNDLPAFTFL